MGCRLTSGGIKVAWLPRPRRHVPIVHTDIALHVFPAKSALGKMLTLQHVNHRVHRAKCSSSPTTSRTMHEHRSGTGIRLWLIIPGRPGCLRSAVVSHNRCRFDWKRRALHHICKFNQSKEMGRLSRCAKVGPSSEVKMRNLPHRLERVGGMRQGKFADSHVRRLALRRLRRGIRVHRHSRIGATAPGFCARLRRSRVGTGPVHVKRRFLLGKRLEPDLSMLFALPIGVTFQLSTLRLGSEHDNDTDVLFPYSIPEVLDSTS